MSVEKSQTYEKKNVFLLGATGIIGAEVLYKLLTLPQFAKFEITILTKCYEKAKQISKLTNGQVKPVVGSARDPFLMYQQLQKADIVINASEVDSVRCAKFISNVATRIKKPFLVLHTSHSTGQSNEHRHNPVDKIISGIQKQNPEFVRAIIVAPPATYDQSNDYVQREFIQTTKLVKLAMKNKQTFADYSSDLNCSSIPIEDLGGVYTMLLRKSLDGQSIKTDKDGYYFAEISALNADKVANSQREHDFTPSFYGSDKAELLRSSYVNDSKFSTKDLLQYVEKSALQENY